MKTRKVGNGLMYTNPKLRSDLTALYNRLTN